MNDDDTREDDKDPRKLLQNIVNFPGTVRDLVDEDDDDEQMTPQELIDKMPIEDLAELIMIGIDHEGSLRVGNTLGSLEELVCVLETLKIRILLDQIQEVGG